jgi:hypothetical protein
MSSGDRKYYTSCTCQCRSSMEASNWRCCNCWYGMRTLKKLTCYFKGIGTTPSIGPYCTSWWWTTSIPLVTEPTSALRKLSPTDAVLQWLHQQHAADVLYENVFWTVCFTHEGVFNVHNNHLWSRANPHVTRFSINVWAGVMGDIILGPYLLLCWLDAQ